MEFQGIPYSMGEFFMQIRFNNSSSFFEEHRKDYNCSVRDPLYALAETLVPSLRMIDPEIETLPSRVVSRIRRDTRFSNDKTPYRDHMWINWRPVRFPSDSDRQRIPGFYLSIDAEHWETGVGYYAAAPATMKAFRAKILSRPDELLSIVQEPAVTAAFRLQGEDYRRPPADLDNVPQYLRSWYGKKSFYFEHAELLGERARTSAFADDVAILLALLGPLYHYMIDLPVG